MLIKRRSPGRPLVGRHSRTAPLMCVCRAADEVRGPVAAADTRRPGPGGVPRHRRPSPRRRPPEILETTLGAPALQWRMTEEATCWPIDSCRLGKLSSDMHGGETREAVGLTASDAWEWGRGEGVAYQLDRAWVLRWITSRPVVLMLSISSVRKLHMAAMHKPLQ